MMCPPVLFLTGVDLTAAAAHRLGAELQARFEVIESPSRHTTVITPEAAVALLDEAGADQAHVVGLSFGAAIAQEIAIRHPQRVRSLVLGASTAGGELYAAPEPDVRDFVRRLDELPAEEGLWASVPYVYAASTWRRNAPLIGEDIANRLRRPLEPSAYREQLEAARAHETAARLAGISSPTLVVHGKQDRILPVENARRLARAIAGAQFMALPGAAHAFLTDVPECHRALVSFLLEHSPRGRRSATRHTGRAARA